MNDLWLRRLIVAAVLLLVGSQFMEWIGGFANEAVGIGGSLLVVAVTAVAARMARVGVGNVLWFLLPTFLFVVVPVAAQTWSFLTDDRGLWARLWDLLPFLLGFAFPILLLLGVYAELRRRDVDETRV